MKTVTAFVIAAVMSGCVGGTAPAGDFREVVDFGSNPGQLRMLTYVPDDLGPRHPLVVVLHGCLQRASTYASEAGWTAAADKRGFALLLPEQVVGNNAMRCFNWFRPGDIGRNGGEALSIKQMVDRVRREHDIDSSRVFVTGLSAGGAMTAVMLATYPEEFAGGAIIAGVPFRCAGSLSEGWTCMRKGKDLSAAAWGDLIRSAANHAGPWPRVSIWHGARDAIVTNVNATELMEQWTNVHGADQLVDKEDRVRGYPHKVYEDNRGNPVVETYLIERMGHGAPVDPGSQDHCCGVPGRYVLDADICAPFYIAEFWGL